MAHGTGADEEDEIHLPSPSFSPAIIGLGITLLCFGLLWAAALIVVGGVVLVIGIATWLIDDARTYAHASDHGGGHGGH